AALGRAAPENSGTARWPENDTRENRACIMADLVERLGVPGMAPTMAIPAARRGRQGGMQILSDRPICQHVLIYAPSCGLCIVPWSRLGGAGPTTKFLWVNSTYYSSSISS